MNFVYAIPFQSSQMITHSFRGRNLVIGNVTQNQERALLNQEQKLLSTKNNVGHAQREQPTNRWQEFQITGKILKRMGKAFPL